MKQHQETSREKLASEEILHLLHYDQKKKKR